MSGHLKSCQWAEFEKVRVAVEQELNAVPWQQFAATLMATVVLFSPTAASDGEGGFEPADAL
jgi:hypothetical protein